MGGLRSLLLLLEHFSKKSSSWETMSAQAGVPTLRDNCPMPLVKISRLFKASTQTSEMNVQQVISPRASSLSCAGKCLDLNKLRNSRRKHSAGLTNTTTVQSTSETSSW